ncbi:MAG: hypothetical protein ABIV13_06175 [Fimbriimonadales bacterium]
MADIKPIGGLGKFTAVALIAAIVGGALFFMGMNEPTIWQSYHFAFVSWSFFTCGCLAMVILINLTRGTWGYPMLRFFESGVKYGLPLMFLGALGMLAMKGHIFEWANPEIVANSDFYQKKTKLWLAEDFFMIRQIVYFAFWMLVAYTMMHLYKKEDQTGDEKHFLKRTVLAAPFAVFFVITLSFAATDWVMSLEEFWFSTIYGLLVTVGSALGATAACILYLVGMWKHEPYKYLLTVKQLRDMGNLTLTLVILWAYMSFSQYLIIWSGNLPEEIIYFVKRREGFWMQVGTALVFLHFLMPFFLLLSSRLKRTPAMLGGTVIFILLMRVVDLIWNVIPSFGRTVQLSDIGAFLMFGGVWFLAFTFALAKVEPTPRYSLLPKEAH